MRTATWRRRFSMARRRASMREGPLAELFRATEAAKRQAEKGEQPREADAPQELPSEPIEETVEHVPDFALEEPVIAAVPEPEPESEPEPAAEAVPELAPDPEPVRLEPVPKPPPMLQPLPEQPAR